LISPLFEIRLLAYSPFPPIPLFRRFKVYPDGAARQRNFVGNVSRKAGLHGMCGS